MGLVVALMGMIGLSLAIISGEIHNRLAFDNQRTSLIELVRLESDSIFKELNSISHDLGLALQQDKEFRNALTNKDLPSLQKQLNNQFHQYFVTADVIRLEKIILFNPEFDVIAESTEGEALVENSIVCPALQQQAMKRIGAQRFRVISDLCLIKKRAYNSVIVPVGGLQLRGYLEIITEPAINLSKIENSLGMPVRVSSPTGNDLFTSDKWSGSEENNNALVATHKLVTVEGNTAISLSVKQNIKPLNESIQQTRFYVIIIAGIVTLLAALISLWVVRKTSLDPLLELTRQV